MIVYADTSALVKRYVREPASEEFNLLLEQAEAVGTAAIAQVEMAAALAKAARLNWVEVEAARQAWKDFLAHWEAFTRLQISAGMLERGARLAWEHELRGYDALHLAAALIWQDTLNLPVLFATFDRPLWQAGRNERLPVWPESLLP